MKNYMNIDELDKLNFLRISYQMIIDTIIEEAQSTQKLNSDFDYNQELLSREKAIFIFYMNGIEMYSVKIWIGNLFGNSERILVSYDKSVYNNDKSCNEMIGCNEDDCDGFVLKTMLNMNGGNEMRDAKGIGEEMWKNIDAHLR